MNKKLKKNAKSELENTYLIANIHFLHTVMSYVFLDIHSHSIYRNMKSTDQKSHTMIFLVDLEIPEEYPIISQHKSREQYTTETV